MALFNYANREITAKVVYYGPGVCGKTTSLQYIHERISPSQRGRLLSLATETDRTIFFDLLPLKLGEIGGFKLRFQLYTVPGQVKYNKTRKLVLQGADAVVFVADSQVNRREANIESLENLRENLLEQNRQIEKIPLVYAYNKRDMDNVISIEELNEGLNAKDLPHFPTIATQGVGVMETLEAISRLALDDMEQRLTTKATSEAKEDEKEAEEALLMEDDDLIDLTGGEDEGLEFSSEELGSLQLESDLSSAEQSDEPFFEDDSGSFLETKPIGYDNNITIEEIEIRDGDVAHTGTLQESEFFNLQDIEEQALRELDDFLEGKLDGEEEISVGEESGEDTGLAFDEGGSLGFDLESDMQDISFSEVEEEKEMSMVETFENDELEGLSLDEEPQKTEAEPKLAFNLEEKTEEEPFSFDLEAPGIEEEAPGEEEALSFDLETTGIETEGIEAEMNEESFAFDLETPDAEVQGALIGAEEKPFQLTTDEDELLAFNLGAEDEEQQSPMDASASGKIEALDISDSDLDLTFTSDEDELETFDLDEAFEKTPKGDIEALDLEESEPGDSFDVEEASSEDMSLADLESQEMQMPSEPSFDDFNITDSVRFEMQYGEDISSVTSFEQQLDELSGEMFADEEEVSKDKFQPEVSDTSEEEDFQNISDEWTRLIVLAKYSYHRAESFRAQHTTSENILAIMMYYAAIETAVKAVASKYESCNPEIASFKLMLESIEEETEKTVAGVKSLMSNIVSIKNRIQLESVYPDDEECELAARIGERFLISLTQDFLSIDFSSLSPVLARPLEK